MSNVDDFLLPGGPFNPYTVDDSLGLSGQLEYEITHYQNGQPRPTINLNPPVRTVPAEILDSYFNRHTNRDQYDVLPGLSFGQRPDLVPPTDAHWSEYALSYPQHPPTTAGDNRCSGAQQLDYLKKNGERFLEIPTPAGTATAFGSLGTPDGSKAAKPKQAKQRAECGCGNSYAINKSRSNTMCRSCTSKTTAASSGVDETRLTLPSENKLSNIYDFGSGVGSGSFQPGGFPHMSGTLGENGGSVGFDMQPPVTTRLHVSGKDTTLDGFRKMFRDEAEVGRVENHSATQDPPANPPDFAEAQQFDDHDGYGTDLGAGQGELNAKVGTQHDTVAVDARDSTVGAKQMKSSRYKYSKERAVCACGKEYALNKDRANTKCRICAKATTNKDEVVQRTTFETKYESTFAGESDALKRLARDPSVTPYYKLSIADDDVAQLNDKLHHQLSAEVFDAILHQPAPAPEHLSEKDVEKYDKKQQEAHQKCKELMSSEADVLDARACSNRVVYAVKHLHIHGVPEIDLMPRRTSTKTGYTIDVESSCLQRVRKMIGLIQSNKRVAFDILKGVFCPIDDFARSPEGYKNRIMFNFNANKNKEVLMTHGKAARNGGGGEGEGAAEKRAGIKENTKAGGWVGDTGAAQSKDADAATDVATAEVLKNAETMDGLKGEETAGIVPGACVSKKRGTPRRGQSDQGGSSSVDSRIGGKECNTSAPNLHPAASSKRKNSFDSTAKPQKRSKKAGIDDYDTVVAGPEALEPDEGAVRVTKTDSLAQDWSRSEGRSS
ncbi:hypothetical protein LTR36_003888 [Oleoguttula mirabilis]|uniref:Uncharacterized protein n=1 Tax=Oleoguttula mirabilis TaxID=1507867 RepID=A0AAV9JIA2_9PEZI|nr:hypothetical protein LTR36_003888 [Oleoguttula mirabilis]